MFKLLLFWTWTAGEEAVQPEPAVQTDGWILAIRRIGRLR